jgi:uncharacterized paraquat-inducible protein A
MPDYDSFYAAVQALQCCQVCSLLPVCLNWALPALGMVTLLQLRRCSHCTESVFYEQLPPEVQPTRACKVRTLHCTAGAGDNTAHDDPGYLRTAKTRF